MANPMKKGSRSAFELLFKFVVISLVLSSLLIVGNGIGRALVQEDTEDFLTLFAEVYVKVLAYYVDEPNPDKLYRGALNGLAESLDPYSTVLSGEVLRKWKLWQEGQIACCDLRLRKGQVEPPFVVSVPYGSKARENGLQAGDYIRKIDGTPTVNLSLGEVQALLCGAEDQTVKMEVWRRSILESVTVNVERQLREVRNPSSVTVNDVLVIRIPQFTPSTAEQIKAILDGREDQPIVWDLRDNDASTVAEFVSAKNVLAILGPIEDAGTLVSKIGGELQEEKIFESVGSADSSVSPSMAALINQGTAAAAEWFAAVIEHQFDGFIMGKATFGKRYLQELLPLEEDLALWMSSHQISMDSTGVELKKGVQPKWELPDDLVAADNRAIWEAATTAWKDAKTEKVTG